MKTKIPGEVARVRRDLSGYAFHFVRRDSTPALTLGRILTDERIVGRVYAPSSIPSVCFTEAPLSEVVRQDGILEEHEYERLSLWGIGFNKEKLYSLGGRPVIYQAPEEIVYLDPAIHWRHVNYVPGRLDYTWQREWRVPLAELAFAPQDIVLVIPEVSAFVRHLWKAVVDVDVCDGEVVLQGGVTKKWDFIPLEFADVSDDASILACRADDWHDIIAEEYYDMMECEGP